MSLLPVSAPIPLKLEGISKRFHTQASAPLWALQGINLQVAAGSVAVIVGSSGCGKSTLLRIVAGLERPDTGTIALGSEQITGPSTARGMVFQEHRLLPWLTVGQNVAFGLQHLAPAAREVTVLSQLASVGLTGFEHCYPRQLSGGMAQRAALARALAPRPAILLLDEPFAALDAFTKVQMQAELLRIQQTLKTSLLLVTHDIEEAVFLGDRVHVMSARPGTIRRSFDVHLSHPRERTSDEFSRLRRAVLDEFRPDTTTAPDIDTQKVPPVTALERPEFSIPTGLTLTPELITREPS